MNIIKGFPNHNQTEVMPILIKSLMVASMGDNIVIAKAGSVLLAQEWGRQVRMYKEEGETLVAQVRAPDIELNEVGDFRK